MKTAYELAMERLNKSAPPAKLTAAGGPDLRRKRLGHDYRASIHVVGGVVELRVEGDGQVRRRGRLRCD